MGLGLKGSRLSRSATWFRIMRRRASEERFEMLLTLRASTRESVVLTLDISGIVKSIRRIM